MLKSLTMSILPKDVGNEVWLKKYSMIVNVINEEKYCKSYIDVKKISNN